MLLGNLKELKNDMINKDWTICSFIFKYKETEYIVLVKRFVGTEKRKNQYALVKLHFMKSDNLGDDMQVEANSNGLIIETQKLREYFGLTSSKKKSGLHGLGIGSIRSAAERLQGVSTFNYQDGIFTLRVVVLNC